MKKISGIDTPVKGGMAVLKPFDIRAHSPDGYVFTRWLATLPLWTPLIILALIGIYPSIAYAQSAFSISDAFGALWRWSGYNGFMAVRRSRWRLLPQRT